MNLLALANCLFGIWLYYTRLVKIAHHPNRRLRFLYCIESLTGLVFAYVYFNVMFLGWQPAQISLYIRPALTILLGCLIGTSIILDGLFYDGKSKSGYDS